MNYRLDTKTSSPQTEVRVIEGQSNVSFCDVLCPSRPVDPSMSSGTVIPRNSKRIETSHLDPKGPVTVVFAGPVRKFSTLRPPL